MTKKLKLQGQRIPDDAQLEEIRQRLPDEIIPDAAKVKEKREEQGVGIPRAFLARDTGELHDRVKRSAEVVADGRYPCRTDVVGIILTPFRREKSQKDKDVEKAETVYKKDIGDILSRKKFTCTELVARIWGKEGIDTADPRFKANKIFMNDIKEYAKETKLFKIAETPLDTKKAKKKSGEA
jgi:hypothetical protein